MRSAPSSPAWADRAAPCGWPARACTTRGLRSTTTSSASAAAMNSSDDHPGKRPQPFPLELVQRWRRHDAEPAILDADALDAGTSAVRPLPRMGGPARHPQRPAGAADLRRRRPRRPHRPFHRAALLHRRGTAPGQGAGAAGDAGAAPLAPEQARRANRRSSRSANGSPASAPRGWKAPTRRCNAR